MSARTVLRLALLLPFLAALPAPAASPEPEEAAAGLTPAISALDLRSEVGFLASDECGGRLTGTDGVYRAARFLAAAFEDAGLAPAPGLDGYFQPFTFNQGVRMRETGNALWVGADALELARDFLPLTFSGEGTAEGEVVFLGYGLVEPREGGYDSYRGVEVDGRVVLCLRDIPEEISSRRRQELALYAGDRYKAKLAADRGAAAFLLVSGPRSPLGGKLIEFRESDRVSSIPIPAVSVTARAASRLLDGADIEALQKALDGGEIDPHAEPVTGRPVRVEAALEAITGTCRNVIGVVPPVDSDQYVMVGAHYDHIGNGEGLGSLAKPGEEGMIHNGADDNASGTAVVAELAAAMAAAEPEGPRRGLIFALWSGEELGLVGSSYYTDHPAIPLESVVGYFNFDMVGRLRDNELIVQAVGSSPAWRGMIERRNVPAGFNLSLQNDPYVPTDLTSFYTRGIAGLWFFTGLHEDYNRPTDDASTLNYEGMERIARFVEDLIEDAAEPGREIAYHKVEEASPPGGRMRRRVFTGVVPDFSAGGDDKMLVSDVRPGSPAEEAGLQGGDVIVEFSGKSIASLQDYADALSGAKPGETVPITVERDGERITLNITPRVREE